MSSIIGKRVKVVRDCGFVASRGEQGRVVRTHGAYEFALSLCLDKRSHTTHAFRLSEVRYLNNKPVKL